MSSRPEQRVAASASKNGHFGGISLGSRVVKVITPYKLANIFGFFNIFIAELE